MALATVKAASFVMSMCSFAFGFIAILRAQGDTDSRNKCVYYVRVRSTTFGRPSGKFIHGSLVQEAKKPRPASNQQSAW